MTPVKPFPGYKWRWLSVAPTESLLVPPVFLGVLRVLARHEGEPPSDPDIARELEVVQEQTGTTVNLVRTPERNLIRNSGQYWKGTGLLLPDRGEIQLTALGHKVAEGKVTQGEFAATMVQQTVLPNPWTYTPAQIAEWQAAGLQIRPLAMILEILDELGRRHGTAAAYITPFELIRICIPLAGTKATSPEITRAIWQYRARRLDISDWPDCAPASNDHRLAKEFLMFLANFGLCRRIPAENSMEDRYALDELYNIEALAVTSEGSVFSGNDDETDEVVAAVRHSQLPSIIERQRTLTMALTRPEQPQFRDRVLDAYRNRCFLTGDSIGVILEAAHIVPVMHRGGDDVANGICLRVDVHRLFDTGNIRIKPTGQLVLSDALLASRNYSVLPERVQIPAFVNPANIQWRDTYY